MQDRINGLSGLSYHCSLRLEWFSERMVEWWWVEFKIMQGQQRMVATQIWGSTQFCEVLNCFCPSEN